MTLCRPPTRLLRPLVSLLWATDGASGSPAAAGRELVLPSGAMHIAIRLGDAPLRIFAGRDDPDGQAIGASILGGVRVTAYCKDTHDRPASVGAVLRPGAFALLSRTPAGALAHRHTCLGEIWPRPDLDALRERLAAAPTPAHRLAAFEAGLIHRLPAGRGIDPLVAHALARFDRGASVGDVVSDSGFSHRHMIRAFAGAVGVPPKAYLRLKRFNRSLGCLHASPTMPLADVAAAAGYADQAHMTRDFRAIAGLTPGQYRRIRPADARHVPVAV